MVAAIVALAVGGQPPSGVGSVPLHVTLHRYGSGLTQVSVADTSSIRPSARILPMRTVLYVCWLSPSILTMPSGAANSIPFAAAFTAATSVDLAFSTASFHRQTPKYPASIGSSVTRSLPYLALYAATNLVFSGVLVVW